MIKHSKKILAVCFMLFLLFFIGLHLLISARGKDILIGKMEKAMNSKVEVGRIWTSLPFSIHIAQVKIEKIGYIKEIVLRPSFLSFLGNDFRLSALRIDSANIRLENSPVSALANTGIFGSMRELGVTKPSGVEAQSPSAQSGVSGAVKPQVNKENLSAIYINRLDIVNGVFNFVDKQKDGADIVIKVADLDIKAKKLKSTGAGYIVADLQINGKIPWGDGLGAGTIEAKGWFNYINKSMQATLRIKDIDAIYLYPYYSNWVDLEKARIEKAKLNFSSDIQGLNNNVVADCRLELAEIVRKPLQEGQEQERAARIADAVLDIFRSMNGGKIELNFTIRTKMDSPEFGFGDIKTAFEDKLAQGRRSSGMKPEDVLSIPLDLLEGTVKTVTQLSKAVIDGVIGVGREIKKAADGTLSKENK